MAESTKEASPRFKARIAGFLYLLSIAGALFIPFAVAPTGLMRGDAALPTVVTIVASPQLYVLSGAAQLFVGACDIGVALLFYELLKTVNRSLALLAAFFRIVFVAIASANLFNHFAPLLLLSGSEHFRAFNPDQLQALALMFIKLRTIGFDVALIFFGFHCLLVGYLVLRSTFLPGVIGLLLGIGGVGYLANIFANAWPAPMGIHLFPYIMLPAGVAEIALALWLATVGLNVAKWHVRAGEARALAS